MLHGKHFLLGALQPGLDGFQLRGLGGKLTLLFFQRGGGRFELLLEFAKPRRQLAQFPLQRQRTGARLLAATHRVAVIAGTVRQQEEQIRVLHTETLDQGEFRQAAQHAEELARQHEDRGAAWLSLAHCHLDGRWRKRRPERAISAARRGLTTGEEVLALRHALSQALVHQGEYEEAESVLAAILDDPAVETSVRASALALRAQALLRGGPGTEATLQQALTDLGAALELAPTLATALLLRADVHLAEQRHEAALADLEVVLGADPGNRRAHYQAQVCHRRLGHPDEARRHHEIWRRIHRLTDSASSASAPDLEERRRLLAELRRLNPDDLERRLDWVALELQADNLPAAADELAELATRIPGSPRLLHLQEQLRQLLARSPGSGE